MVRMSTAGATRRSAAATPASAPFAATTSSAASPSKFAVIAVIDSDQCKELVQRAQGRSAALVTDRPASLNEGQGRRARERGTTMGGRHHRVTRGGPPHLLAVMAVAVTAAVLAACGDDDGAASG